MHPAIRTVFKNLVVAATLGLAALATWAVTDSHAPAIVATELGAQQG
jgi:hypothetical protein